MALRAVLTRATVDSAVRMITSSSRVAVWPVEVSLVIATSGYHASTAFMQHPGRSWRNGGHRPFQTQGRHGTSGLESGKLGRAGPQDEGRAPFSRLAADKAS